MQAAEQVAQETSKAMRAILKGTILILPSLPSPQPAQGSAPPPLCCACPGYLPVYQAANLQMLTWLGSLYTLEIVH